MQINEISGQIVDAAVKVHSVLGPGLFEGAYEGCLLHELRIRGMSATTPVILPVAYEGVTIELGYRLDLVVEDAVIVERGSKVLPLHCPQLLTYLRLSGKRVGLLLNFNVVHMRDGIKRMVNSL